MKINMSLTENKRGLQVTVILPKRNLATEPILTKSQREIISMVKEEYPEFIFVSGPRKVSNNPEDNLTATWAFEMPAQPQTVKSQPKPKTTSVQKKTTTRKRKTTSSQNKA